MELSTNRTVKLIAILLFLTAISQPLYTALYRFAPDFDRQFLWGIEALLFVLLATVAGSALVVTKRYALGFSAIAFSAILNVLQVGIGLTQFAPFGEVARANAELSALTTAIVAFSFFIYNAAKLLLGLAALIFGLAHFDNNNKIMAMALIVIGAVAFFANLFAMMLGSDSFLPRHVAGASGVLATLLLSICMFNLSKQNIEDKLNS